MNINDFIVSFAEQFVDTGAEDLSPETKFKELEEWDSLIVLSIIAMVNSEYDVTITGRDIREAETISDLYDCVVELKG